MSCNVSVYRLSVDSTYNTRRIVLVLNTRTVDTDSRQGHNMYLLIIIGPLLGALISIIYGRQLGNKGISIVAIAATSIGAISGTIAAYEVLICGSSTYINLGN